MPISLDVYHLDGDKPVPIPPSGMDEEKRLQEILASRIEILDGNLLVIGREVYTPWDSRIDILAIDNAGELVVIELKRDRTPREVVAQVLEYGSWVRTLDNAGVAEVFQNYLRRYRPDKVQQSLDDAFKERFQATIPDELNTGHRLLVAASELDPGTERILAYLAEAHHVPVNAVFFRVFRDNGREYLTRAWLREPDEAGETVTVSEPHPWTGEFYANFGHSSARDWETARKYGFISAGGGNWYTLPLNLLQEGGRVWVNVPGSGYVAVGLVSGGPVPVNNLVIDGQRFRDLPGGASYGIHEGEIASTSSEVAVRVKWLHTVPIEEAVKEKGFYGNQWTVTKSGQPKWKHTVERLKARWNIAD